MQLNYMKMRMAAGRRPGESFFDHQNRRPYCLLTCRSYPSYETAPDDGHSRSINQLIANWSDSLKTDETTRKEFEETDTMQVTIAHNFYHTEPERHYEGMQLMRDLATAMQIHFKPPNLKRLRIKFDMDDHMNPNHSETFLRLLRQTTMRAVHLEIATAPTIEYFYQDSPMTPMLINPQHICDRPVTLRLSFVRLKVEQFCHFVGKSHSLRKLTLSNIIIESEKRHCIICEHSDDTMFLETLHERCRTTKIEVNRNTFYNEMEFQFQTQHREWLQKYAKFRFGNIKSLYKRTSVFSVQQVILAIMNASHTFRHDFNRVQAIYIILRHCAQHLFASFHSPVPSKKRKIKHLSPEQMN